MRPLLEVIRAAEATYRWDHPFHLNVRKQGSEFHLRSLDQLPGLFSFLNQPAVSVPNWFNYLLTQEALGPTLPRLQRVRRPCSHAPSREAARSHPMSSEA